MTIRLDYFKHADREPLVAMSALSGYLQASDLDPSLLHLVQLRASQLNGCAYCVDMHVKDLQALGEQPDRIHLLVAWQEANIYTPAERAALDWTEAVTHLRPGRSLDQTYQRLAEHYPQQSILQITFLIVAINGWNRLSIAFGRDVGSYKPGDHDAMLQQSLKKLLR